MLAADLSKTAPNPIAKQNEARAARPASRKSSSLAGAFLSPPVADLSRGFPHKGDLPLMSSTA
jgi:hypothetical protein